MRPIKLNSIIFTLCFFSQTTFLKADNNVDQPDPIEATAYTRSTLKNCKNYNNLINSVQYNIADEERINKEYKNCGRMIKDQSDDQWWEDFGADKIMEKIDNMDETPQTVAKNIILFVGGGMNVDTITAARIQAGKWAATKKHSGCGEEHELSFEKFPYSGFSKTYAIDSQTPSSRSAGTAILSGFKSRSSSVNCMKNGVYEENDKQKYHCKEKGGKKNNKVPVLPNSILKKMKIARGKDKFKTGIVTNTAFYDGTTAAAFAKQRSVRQWSLNGIAESMDHALKTRMLDLSFSGGRQNYSTNKNASVINYFTKNNNPNGDYDVISSKAEMLSLDNTTMSDKSIVGMFADYDLKFEDQRCVENDQEEPSLSEMSKKAVDLLHQGGENGFFLMVEAGKIEKAHHHTQGLRAVNEAVELDLAITKTINKLKELKVLKDTLIVVTADHGHTFTFGAWDSPRGIKMNKVAPVGAAALIFNPAGIFKSGMSIGGYYAGPQEQNENVHMDDIDKKQMSAVNVTLTPISGEDVPVYGKGPFSHLLSGVHEQSYVGNVLAYAGCTKEHWCEVHCQNAGFKCPKNWFGRRK